MLPHTTKRRVATNLKTKNQNCQNIELYKKSDNQGVKEETFIYWWEGQRWESRGRGHAAREQTRWAR